MATINIKEQERLVQALNEIEFLDYGERMPMDQFDTLCNLVKPDIGTAKDFQKYDLTKLAYTNFLKEYCRSRGMYFYTTRDVVGIYLPGENMEAVRTYCRAGANKFQYAAELLHNTPVEYQTLEAQQEEYRLNRMRIDAEETANRIRDRVVRNARA